MLLKPFPHSSGVSSVGPGLDYSGKEGGGFNWRWSKVPDHTLHAIYSLSPRTLELCNDGPARSRHWKTFPGKDDARCNIRHSFFKEHKIRSLNIGSKLRGVVEVPSHEVTGLFALATKVIRRIGN